MDCLFVHLALSHIETNCRGEYLCSIPIRREVPNTCPYCNNEQALKGYNTIPDIYLNYVIIGVART